MEMEIVKYKDGFESLVKYQKSNEPLARDLFSNKYRVTDGAVNVVEKEVYCKDLKKKVKIRRDIGISNANREHYETHNLSLIENDLIRREPVFTKFDVIVHDCVCTLYNNGFYNFTALQIYRLMSGDYESRINNDTPIIKAIEASLDLMMKMFIYINFEAEAKLYKFKLYDDSGNQIISVKGSILELREVRMRLRNGSEVKAFHIYNQPPLYTYASLKKELITFNTKHLDIPGIRHTEKNEVLKNDLMNKAILVFRKTKPSGGLKKHFENCNIINLESIYKEYDADDYKKKTRLKSTVLKILDFWTNESHLLTSYKLDGDKIRITVNRKEFIAPRKDDGDVIEETKGVAISDTGKEVAVIGDSQVDAKEYEQKLEADRKNLIRFTGGRDESSR